MNIRKLCNLIPIRLPRRTQAHLDSLYSLSKRNTDLSHSISESHARQKHPYDATPTRSTTSSVQASTAPFPRRAFLSPSSSSSSARRISFSPFLLFFFKSSQRGGCLCAVLFSKRFFFWLYPYQWQLSSMFMQCF